MTDLSKLTAKDFSDAMHKGWKQKRYCRGQWFELSDAGSMCAVCAIGAMTLALGEEPNSIANRLDALSHSDMAWSDIAKASDTAGNKRAAMKAVDAILLNTPAVRGGE